MTKNRPEQDDPVPVLLPMQLQETFDFSLVARSNSIVTSSCTNLVKPALATSTSGDVSGKLTYSLWLVQALPMINIFPCQVASPATDLTLWLSGRRGS
jgi:hypothetical protein